MHTRPARPAQTSARAPTTAWRIAQRYELAHWDGVGRAEIESARGRFAEAAGGLAALFDRFAEGDWRERVLQVGPAALAEIHFLPARERVALEPLAAALAARGLLQRDRGVRWVCGMGEALPFPDARFSAVLRPNVIDHVADPLRVLREVRRCLVPGGLLWLSSHVSHALVLPAFRALHALRLGYFAGHPWYFSPAGLDRLAAAAGFRPLSVQRTGSERAERKGLLRDTVKRRLLGVRYLLLAAGRAPA